MNSSLLLGPLASYSAHHPAALFLGKYIGYTITIINYALDKNNTSDFRTHYKSSLIKIYYRIDLWFYSSAIEFVLTF